MSMLSFPQRSRTTWGLAMQRKLTINIDEHIYERLNRIIGEQSISQFIENLVRPYVIESDLDAAYQSMAEDESRESEALVWSEALIGDVLVEDSSDEAW